MLALYENLKQIARNTWAWLRRESHSLYVDVFVSNVEHPPALNARKWADEFEALDHHRDMSGFLMTYSEARIRDFEARIKTVEDKADSLFKFVAGMVGVLIAWSQRSDASLGGVALDAIMWPSLMTFMVAIGCTLYARKTEGWSIPVELCDLAQYSATENEGKLYVAKSLYVCLKDGLPLMARKARFVQRAFFLTMIGVGLLIFFWLMASMWPPRRTASGTKKPLTVIPVTSSSAANRWYETYPGSSSVAAAVEAEAARTALRGA